jgi:ribosomal protein S18 acetylase RimI-like enzyme
MTMEDYDQVYALWMSCTGMGLNNLDDSREGISSYLKRNPRTCFVAEDDGQRIGDITAGHDGRRGDIYHTAVHPNRRRGGIGNQLVDAAMSALREEGINKVALVVFERNTSGNAFWEALGFEQRFDLAYRNKALTDIIRYDT